MGLYFSLRMCASECLVERREAALVAVGRARRAGEGGLFHLRPCVAEF